MVSIDRQLLQLQLRAKKCTAKAIEVPKIICEQVFSDKFHVGHMPSLFQDKSYDLYS